MTESTKIKEEDNPDNNMEFKDLCKVSRTDKVDKMLQNISITQKNKLFQKSNQNNDIINNPNNQYPQPINTVGQNKPIKYQKKIVLHNNCNFCNSNTNTEITSSKMNSQSKKSYFNDYQNCQNGDFNSNDNNIFIRLQPNSINCNNNDEIIQLIDNNGNNKNKKRYNYKNKTPAKAKNKNYQNNKYQAYRSKTPIIVKVYKKNNNQNDYQNYDYYDTYDNCYGNYYNDNNNVDEINPKINKSAIIYNHNERLKRFKEIQREGIKLSFNENKKNDFMYLLTAEDIDNFEGCPKRIKCKKLNQTHFPINNNNNNNYHNNANQKTFCSPRRNHFIQDKSKVIDEDDKKNILNKSCDFETFRKRITKYKTRKKKYIKRNKTSDEFRNSNNIRSSNGTIIKKGNDIGGNVHFKRYNYLKEKENESNYNKKLKKKFNGDFIKNDNVNNKGYFIGMNINAKRSQLLILSAKKIQKWWRKENAHRKTAKKIIYIQKIMRGYLSRKNNEKNLIPQNPLDNKKSNSNETNDNNNIAKNSNYHDKDNNDKLKESIKSIKLNNNNLNNNNEPKNYQIYVSFNGDNNKNEKKINNNNTTTYINKNMKKLNYKINDNNKCFITKKCYKFYSKKIILIQKMFRNKLINDKNRANNISTQISNSNENQINKNFIIYPKKTILEILDNPNLKENLQNLNTFPLQENKPNTNNMPLLETNFNQIPISDMKYENKKNGNNSNYNKKRNKKNDDLIVIRNATHQILGEKKIPGKEIKYNNNNFSYIMSCFFDNNNNTSIKIVNFTTKQRTTNDPNSRSKSRPLSTDRNFTKRYINETKKDRSLTPINDDRFNYRRKNIREKKNKTILKNPKKYICYVSKIKYRLPPGNLINSNNNIQTKIPIEVKANTNIPNKIDITKNYPRNNNQNSFYDKGMPQKKIEEINDDECFDNNEESNNNVLLSKKNSVSNTNSNYSIANNFPELYIQKMDSFRKSKMSFASSSLRSTKFKYDKLYYNNFLKYLFLDNAVFYFSYKMKFLNYYYRYINLLFLLKQKISKNINQFVFYAIKKKGFAIQTNLFFSVIKKYFNPKSKNNKDLFVSNGNEEISQLLRTNLQKNYLNYKKNHFISFIYPENESKLINTQLFNRDSNNIKLRLFICNYLRNQKNLDSLSPETIRYYLKKKPLKNFNIFTITRYINNIYYLIQMDNEREKRNVNSNKGMIANELKNNDNNRNKSFDNGISSGNKNLYNNYNFDPVVIAEHRLNLSLDDDKLLSNNRRNIYYSIKKKMNQDNYNIIIEDIDVFNDIIKNNNINVINKEIIDQIYNDFENDKKYLRQSPTFEKNNRLLNTKRHIAKLSSCNISNSNMENINRPKKSLTKKKFII